MAPFLRKLHARGLPAHSPLLSLRPPCSHSSFPRMLDEIGENCGHQMSSWKWENSYLRGDEFQSTSCCIFPRWIAQLRGQLGSFSCSTSASLSQQWSGRLFARSMSMKSREDRRKKDLARREFQLLRRRTKLLKVTLSPEERLLWRLRKSNRKKAVLLQRLKKYELDEEPEPVHDPELITPEQHQALKKIGYKNRNYVPVGRRGVYGGVVQNMHMHWKFHETVQVDCHIFKREDIRSIARQLAVLSGGIVIDIHQATTIIMYRGKNYKQPKTEMIPANTLTKRKALFKSKFLQALEGLETNIKDIEAQLQILRRNQKENSAQGIENNTSKPPHIVGDKLVDSNLLANLDEISSDDDDAIFSWESDSLDEEELSDDDDSKNKKAEEVHLDKKEIAKPLSWTTGDSARRGGKKDRLTAKELILAEQELFKNSPKRLAAGEQKNDLVSSENEELNNNSVDSDDNSGTDDDADDEDSNHIKDGKFEWLDSFNKVNEKKLPRHSTEVEQVSSTDYDLEGFSEEDISSYNGKKSVKKSEVATSVKGHRQIMNKKIAKFVEQFMTDEDEEDELFGTDFENEDDIRESKTGPSMADAKDTQE